MIDKINNELILIEGIGLHDKRHLPPHNSRYLDNKITYTFDGYALDEVKITLTIKSSIEAKYLIDNINELKLMLQIHEHCLPPYPGQIQNKMKHQIDE